MKNEIDSLFEILQPCQNEGIRSCDRFAVNSTANSSLLTANARNPLGLHANLLLGRFFRVRHVFHAHTFTDVLLVYMRYYYLILSSALALSGCSSDGGRSLTTTAPATTVAPENTATGSGGATTTPGAGGATTTTDPDATTSDPPRSTVPPSSSCPGKRLGQYTWGTELWRQGARELSNFFGTADGKEWGCGDLTINIGDFSAPRTIAFKEDIVPFILAYRQSSGNYESVVWLSYGDVESGDGSLMLTFIDTFYAWASAIPADVASSLGTIGLSFDVEHMPASATKQGLQKAQALKASTNFASGKLLVQHTIEGRPNPDGTDYVMKYADSALIMLYRNYMTSSTFSSDSNILSRAAYFLRDQCVHCLEDSYATANYQAKVTIMVEASCAPADYCAKISFCAHDSPSEGAKYLWDTLQELEAGMLSSGLVSSKQFERLFNPYTTFSVHDWGWFRCYAPLTASSGTGQCRAYASSAERCRKTLGPVPTAQP